MPGSGITDGMTPVPPSMVLVHDPRWDAVLARDSRTDFVYAVQTTRVYCRPSCPSRRPRPENVTFFPLGAEAERHGFRACRRCRPDQTTIDPRTERVEAACRTLAARVGVSPSLDELATEVGTTPDTLRRDFRRVLGVSPKQYADALRVERLRAELRDGRDVTGALYTAGYGSSSRLYEQSDARLGMTPASYGARRRGSDHLVHDRAERVGSARRRDDGARRVLDRARGRRHRARSASARASSPPPTSPATTTRWRRSSPRSSGASTATFPPSTLPVDVRGTAFQQRVWQELRRIPRGETRSYGEIAAAVGAPGGARAVGQACGSNPVAIVVPCHRVVQASGALGGYAWGLDVKRQLLEREQQERP